MDWLTQVRWSPYLVGTGIGILSWFTWLLSNEPIGCSTTFSRSAGMFDRLLRNTSAEKMLYFQEVKPVVDWQFMLVVGIIIGAFVSSVISGDFTMQWIPSVWSFNFGDNILLRLIIGFTGGILLGFGSRWADGCTSGHGISGAMQLAASSWISAICFFAGGIIMAWFMFRVIS